MIWNWIRDGQERRRPVWHMGAKKKNSVGIFTLEDSMEEMKINTEVI